MTNAERTRVGDRITIYPRGKKKTYYADFWYDGEHRRQSLKTTNKKVATQRAVEIDAGLTAGTFAAPVPPTNLRSATDQYFAYLESEGRARKTIVRYRGELRAFSEFCAGRRVHRLGQINMSLFDADRADRRRIHAERTVYHESVVVKQFLNWCRLRQLIAVNPLQDYRLGKPKHAPKGGPSLAQVNQILAATTGTPRLQYAVLAFTGMRSGELRQLRPADVDLDGNWIRIVSRPGAETKTRESWQVPIHPRLRALLLEVRLPKLEWYFTAEASNRYPAGGHWINTKKLNDRFLTLLRRLKIPAGRSNEGFTIHSFRHFFKTHCINCGVPKPVVDTWRGHRIDQTVGAHYYRLSNEESQKFMSEVSFNAGESASDEKPHSTQKDES